MQNYWAALLILPIITWYSMFGVLDRNYNIVQKDIENVVYNYTQIAAKKGELYESVFDEMCSKLSKYGEYEIFLTAEKFEDGVQAPLIIRGEDILDRSLREEGYDLLNISVVYVKRHPVSIMYEYTVFGVPNGKSYDFRLVAKSCSYIQ